MCQFLTHDNTHYGQLTNKTLVVVAAAAAAAAVAVVVIIIITLTWTGSPPKSNRLFLGPRPTCLKILQNAFITL